MGPKTTRDVVASTAMASNIANEIGNTSIAGDNMACSDRGSGKNRCGDDILSAEGRRCIKKPLCYGCRQKEEKKLL